jgi:hypothetical protein
LVQGVEGFEAIEVLALTTWAEVTEFRHFDIVRKHLVHALHVILATEPAEKTCIAFNDLIFLELTALLHANGEFLKVTDVPPQDNELLSVEFLPNFAKELVGGMVCTELCPKLLVEFCW